MHKLKQYLGTMMTLWNLCIKGVSMRECIQIFLLQASSLLFNRHDRKDYGHMHSQLMDVTTLWNAAQKHNHYYEKLELTKYVEVFSTCNKSLMNTVFQISVWYSSEYVGSGICHSYQICIFPEITEIQLF